MTSTTVTWRVDFGGGRRPRRPRAATDGDAPSAPQGTNGAAEPPRVGPRRADAADRLARRLALAHHLEDLIERGVLRDHAHTAQVLGISRPRVSQVAALLALSPEIQERILVGTLPCSEREVRAVAAEPCWDEQARMVEALVAARKPHPDRAGAAHAQHPARDERA